MLRKFIRNNCLIVVLIVLLTLMSVSVSANTVGIGGSGVDVSGGVGDRNDMLDEDPETGWQYNVQNNGAIITGSTKNVEVLQIPETLGGYPVTGITSLGEAVFQAKEIIIPDSVTMLSDTFLYAQFIPLEKLTVGSGVSTLNLLHTAPKLKEVVVSADNPYLNVKDSVVYDENFTKLIAYPAGRKGTHSIPDTVTDISMLFDNANWFGALNIQTGTGTPEYKTVDGVVYSADMTTVYYCSAEKSGAYVMPDSVTTVAHFALSNSNIEEVTLSPNVTSMVYTSFHSNLKLEKLTVPKTVEELGGFEGSSLKEIHIEDVAAWCAMRFDSNPLQIAKDLYLDGQLIRDLVIPEGVESISSTAFINCSAQTVTIPASLKRCYYDAFVDCGSLTGVYITDLAAWCGIDFSGVSANPLYYAKDLYHNGALVQNLKLPTTVQTVNPYAFYNGSMTSLEVPANVKEIQDEAFCGSALEKITIQEGLEIIGGYAFERSALRSVDLPDSLTEMRYGAFYRCKQLESVTFGSGLKSIGYNAFAYTNLYRVVIPATVEQVQTGAFHDSNLREVIFEGNDTEIWVNAFAYCPLRELDLPDNLNYIWDSAFEGTAIATVTIPESVTAISYRSFAFSDNLMSVVIPETVQSINPFAFEDDENLGHVLYTGTQEQWNALGVESAELLAAKLHLNATGNEITVKQNCTEIEHYCAICDEWTKITRKTPLHVMVDGVCTYCGYEEKSDGWYQENGKWYFYENRVKVCNAWRQDSEGWVYLGSDGAMLTNSWCQDSQGWCYVGADGYAVINCWKQDSYGWIWLGANGSMVKNQWIQDGGKWYWLNANGYMVTNKWQQDSKGWVFIGKDGYMLTNAWCQDSQGWCYVGSDGYAVTNCWKQDSAGWIWLDANGSMVKNQWQKDSKGWVYIGSSGYMLTNAWCTDSLGWCYVGADGYAVTNCWKRDSTGWIWLDGNGSMTKNQWIQDGGNWYYLNANGYMLANTTLYYGGKTYYFNASGICTNP